jgi:hypothetical protein
MDILIVMDREQFARRFAHTLAILDQPGRKEHDVLHKCLREFAEYLYNRIVLQGPDPGWVLSHCCSGNLHLMAYNPRITDGTPMYQDEVTTFEADISAMVREAIRQFQSNGSTLDEILAFAEHGRDKIGLVLVASQKSN